MFHGKVHAKVAMTADFGYIATMNCLTKQEQLVLCIVVGLLLTGWAVKTYRAAHPPTGTQPGEIAPATTGQTAKP